MRVGANVLMREQRCVQSYNWSLQRPLGNLQWVIDELGEYECDEITIIRPVRAHDSLETFKQDLAQLRQLKSLTPISLGGGLRDTQQLSLLQGLPIERLVFSSAFIENNVSLIRSASQIFGRQSIQCLLPLKLNANKLSVFHSTKAEYQNIDRLDLAFIDEFANEIIIYDTEHEGEYDTFDQRLLSTLQTYHSVDYGKLIVSGGVGHSTVNWAMQKGLASVLIDNKALHTEYAIEGYKHAL